MLSVVVQWIAPGLRVSHTRRVWRLAALLHCWQSALRKMQCCGEALRLIKAQALQLQRSPPSSPSDRQCFSHHTAQTWGSVAASRLPIGPRDPQQQSEAEEALQTLPAPHLAVATHRSGLQAIAWSSSCSRSSSMATPKDESRSMQRKGSSGLRRRGGRGSGSPDKADADLLLVDQVSGRNWTAALGAGLCIASLLVQGRPLTPPHLPPTAPHQPRHLPPARCPRLPLQPAGARYRSFRVRTISTFVLIASFFTIIWAGHVPLMFMVLGIQASRAAAWRFACGVHVGWRALPTPGLVGWFACWSSGGGCGIGLLVRESVGSASPGQAV